MGPFLQFRLWLRDAPRIELRAWASVTAVVALLTVWAVTPLVTDDDEGNEQHTTLAAVDGTAGTTPTPTSGAEGAAPAPAAGQVVPASGGPSGARALTQAVGGAATSSAAGEPAKAPAGAAAAALTRSDQGVTEREIKLGFSIYSLAGLDQAGVAVGLRGDMSQAIDAFVDDANKNGGVNGRRIVAVKRKVDATDVTDQRQKCIELTEAEGVFAVMDYGAFTVAATRGCFTVEHKTPLFTWKVGTSAEVRRAAPLQVSMSKDENRRTKDLVASAKAMGSFDPAKGFTQLGILSDTCIVDALDNPDGLKSYLRQAGFGSWSEHRLDCDVASAQRGAGQAVLQHRRDGVSHVILATSAIGSSAYMNAAQSQAWKPTYIVSDFGNHTLDTAAQLYNENQFDGIRAESQWHHGDPSRIPEVQACSKILTDRGLPPITNFRSDVEVVTVCENFKLFLSAARRVGPNLTRVALGEAVQRSGDMRGSYTELGRFSGAGKLSGGDTLAPVEWRRNCKCWVEVGPFHPAHG